MHISVHGYIHTKSWFARKMDVDKLPTYIFLQGNVGQWSMPRNMENSINKTNHFNQAFLYPFQYFWYTKWISIPFHKKTKKNNQQTCVFGSTPGNGHCFTRREFIRGFVAVTASPLWLPVRFFPSISGSMVGGCWWFGTCFFTGTIEFYDFHSLGNFIIPTDEHSMIFQKGRYTTNQHDYWANKYSIILKELWLRTDQNAK